MQRLMPRGTRCAVHKHGVVRRKMDLKKVKAERKETN
jgi:hypothetical protein